MANPEQGLVQQGAVGEWQTIRLGPPDFLEPVRQAVDAFFSALIQVLNILLQILEILKTFAVGFLDPIIALVEELLELIERLLRDLRQAGLYIHGDFYILKGAEYRDLLGGFTAYERRMITRLVDRRDPNRPNLSSASAVVAVFFYVSADISAMERILLFLRGILQLFNRRVNLPPSLGSVVNVRATYGLEGVSVTSFTTPGFFPTRERLKNQAFSDVFNAVNITWQMAPTPGNFVTTFAQLPPAGFLVEVSTQVQGITVQYDKPVKGANEASEDNRGRTAGTAVDVDGNPIVLFGGVDQLALESSLEFNQGTTLTNTLKPLAARVYGVRNLSDAAPIQFSDLRDGEDYFLQRTFFTPGFQASFFPGKGFGITIPHEAMPRDAEFEMDGAKVKVKHLGRPSQYFVRVRAVSRNVSGPQDFQYDVTQTVLDSATTPVAFPLRNSLTLSDVGPPSAPLDILFPGAFTEDYLRSVISALIVLALSRADIPVKVGTTVDEQGNPTTHELDFPPSGDDLLHMNVTPSWGSFEGRARRFTRLEDLAGVLFPMLIRRKRNIGTFYRSTDDLSKWRNRLLTQCVNLCNRMFLENRPPPSLEQTVVQTCTDLLDFRLSDIRDEYPDLTLIEALRDREGLKGIAPNPLSVGIKSEERAVTQTSSVSVLARGPHFFQVERGQSGSVIGSNDLAPVFFARDRLRPNLDIEAMTFARNAFSDAIYEQAAFALRVALGPVQRPQEKGWIAIRLFPQGIPAIDRFLDELLALLRSIRAALQAITDMIKRFIEFLQSRIIELQALLNRINAMIQNLLRLFLDLPAASGLVVIANGTDGVLQALVSAPNKPFDSPVAYGGGAVLLAGGIPTVALDLFKALVSGGD